MRSLAWGALVCALAVPAPRAEPLLARQQARFSMGTMFEATVYHGDAAAADRAIGAALAEVVRLDRILSHFKPESDLSRLNREGGTRAVAVDPSLHDVLERAVRISRETAGRFDVTVGPLLRLWESAYAEGRIPSPGEREHAARCVGYERLELLQTGRIRFTTACTEVNLGGIGKGYAVDRALGVLQEHGIRHALVNAGGSTIAAIGHPPGSEGWPVRLRASVDGADTLLLANHSISTSQQQLVPLAFGGGTFGEILDPALGAPVRNPLAVSVISASATASDALATALVLMDVGEGRALLERFPGTGALWMTPEGNLHAAHLPAGFQHRAPH